MIEKVNRPRKYLNQIISLEKEINNFQDYADEKKFKEKHTQWVKNLENLELPKAFFGKRIDLYFNNLWERLSTLKYMSFSALVTTPPSEAEKNKIKTILDIFIIILNKEIIVTGESLSKKEYSKYYSDSSNLPHILKKIQATGAYSLMSEEQIKKIQKDSIKSRVLKPAVYEILMKLYVQEFTKEFDKIIPIKSQNKRYDWFIQLPKQESKQKQQEVYALFDSFMNKVLAKTKEYNYPDNFIIDHFLRKEIFRKMVSNINNTIFFANPKEFRDGMQGWIKQIVAISYKKVISDKWPSYTTLAYDLHSIEEVLPENKLEIIKLYDQYNIENSKKLDFCYSLAGQNFFKDKQTFQEIKKWIGEVSEKDINYLKTYRDYYCLGDLYLLHTLGVTDTRYFDYKSEKIKIKKEIWFFDIHDTRWKEIFENMDLFLKEELPVKLFKASLVESMQQFKGIAQFENAMKKITVMSLLDFFPLKKKEFVNFSYNASTSEQLSVSQHFAEPLWTNIKYMMDLKKIKLDTLFKKLFMQDSYLSQPACEIIESFKDDPQILKDFFRNHACELLKHHSSQTWYEDMPKEYMEELKKGFVHRKINKDDNYSSSVLLPTFIANTDYLSKTTDLNEKDKNKLLKDLKNMNIHMNEFASNLRVIFSNNINSPKDPQFIFNCLMNRICKSNNQYQREKIKQVLEFFLKEVINKKYVLQSFKVHDNENYFLIQNTVQMLNDIKLKEYVLNYIQLEKKEPIKLLKL